MTTGTEETKWVGMAAGEDKSRQVDKDIRSENSRRVDLTAAA